MATRILVIGGKDAVVQVITRELAACGFDATGMTMEVALSTTDGEYDLVSFGAGVPSDTRRLLQEQIGERSPNARFIRTYAPYAVSQIVASARSEGRVAGVDLDAYCRRVGYQGSLEPTIETLRALLAHHIAAIPFEAIDVLMGRRIDLSPEAVDDKLIRRHRGGYCFEQNSLFKRVLTAIGFDVQGLLASVRWRAEPGAPPPARTHMALRVEIDEVPWLADVGFGSSVPPAPLRIDVGDEQPTRHGDYRAIPLGAGTLIQTKMLGDWQSLYDVLSEPVLDGHYEVPNWFTSTHPSSHFRQGLVVARTTLEARYALAGNQLTIRAASGEVDRRQLDFCELERALEDFFLLEMQPAWRPMLQQAAVGLA